MQPVRSPTRVGSTRASVCGASSNCIASAHSSSSPSRAITASSQSVGPRPLHRRRRSRRRLSPDSLIFYVKYSALVEGFMSTVSFSHVLYSVLFVLISRTCTVFIFSAMTFNQSKLCTTIFSQAVLFFYNLHSNMHSVSSKGLPSECLESLIRQGFASN